MRWSLAGLAALILVAGLVIAIRSVASTSSSCQASAQGVGIPGSPPPYTPPTGLQAQGQPDAPLMTIASTPSYKGTPPPGFVSWDDYAQYIFSGIRALPMGTAVTNFGAAIPTVDIGTPHYPSGTPPLGFKSWADLIAWAETQLGGAKQGGSEIILQPAAYTPQPGGPAAPSGPVPLQTVHITPNYRGTPPPGFASWDAYAQWAIGQVPSGVKPPSYATFQVQVPASTAGPTTSQCAAK